MAISNRPTKLEAVGQVTGVGQSGDMSSLFLFVLPNNLPETIRKCYLQVHVVSYADDFVLFKLSRFHLG